MKGASRSLGSYVRLRAFTLIELLLVIALLGLLASVAAPRLNGSVRARQLEGAARELEDIVRLGRAEAVRRGLRVRLELDGRAREYVLRLQNPEHSTREEYVVFGDGYLDEPRRLPDGVRFLLQDDAAAAVRNLVFAPTGLGDEASIELADRRGRRASVRLGTWFEDVETEVTKAAELENAPWPSSS